MAPRSPRTRRAQSDAPSPTLVLLVRHGQTATTGSLLPGRAPGLHLAETGQAQAQRAADRIGALKRVDALYSSPLERTRETAAPIGRATGLKVHRAKGLLECDFGEWTGAELKALRKLPEWKLVQSHPSGFRFPGGESFTEMQTRIWNELGRLVTAHPGETVVAVSHADPIKAAVAHAIGTPLDLFQRIMIGTASISAIAYSPSSSSALTVNSVDGDLTKLGIK